MSIRSLAFEDDNDEEEKEEEREEKIDASNS
jgi:hypothetical protein